MSYTFAGKIWYLRKQWFKYDATGPHSYSARQTLNVPSEDFHMIRRSYRALQNQFL